jgi:hypothetical protein
MEETFSVEATWHRLEVNIYLGVELLDVTRRWYIVLTQCLIQ